VGRTLAVLANRTAGKGRHAHLLDGVLERLGAAATVLDAHDAGSALAACRAAVQDGVDGLVAFGGDGTVHLALQAVAGTPTPLGIIPAGTGNDFADAVGVPRDAFAAAEVIVGGVTREVDAVRAKAADGTDRWWSTILCAGFDSAVNERANRMRWPRGPRRYDLAIFAELVRLAPREFTVDLDGERWQGPATLVAVGNSASYGGGMRMCPAADPADGVLDVTIVGPLSRTTLIRTKPRIYAGTHIEHPQVSTHRAASVTLSAVATTAYADGEPFGPLPVTMTCVPGALRVFSGP
jgi:diacylglycerol kinase (ATP)